MGPRRERQPAADQDRAERGEGQLPGGPRPEEWRAGGTDDVHDQRLGHEGLHEPPGVEKHDEGGLARFIQGRPGAELGGAEIPHQAEGQVVEERGDRAKPQHEAADAGDIPLLGPADLVGLDPVERNAGLRKIVEEHAEQDEDRAQRDERQQGRSPDDREHVAEVRRRAHADVLLDVAEDATPFVDAVDQHQQGFLQQDRVGRLLGDVDGRVDGDADVGRLEGEHVVDAIAHEADRMSLPLEGADDLLLLGGREPGEDVGLDHRGIELRRRHSGELGAGQHPPDGHAHVDAHLAGDELIVAGEDLGAYAAGAQAGEGLGGGVLGRIEEGEIAEQHQA